MQIYTFAGYTMTLEDTGGTGEYGKGRVAYTFSKPTGELLFSGNDLFTPFRDPEGLECAKTLLTFLTLQPGDIDDEYFDKYTPEQLEWAKSFECEQLQVFADDEE